MRIVETVGVVCRHNLVRSKFLASFLNRNYPDFDFWSAGTQILKGARFEFELKFLKRFGVSIVNTECRSLEYSASNEPTPTLIFIAEKSQRERVANVYPNSEIVMLDEIGSHLGLELCDPMGFSKPDLEQELYKYAFVASYAMNQYVARKLTLGKKIESMIPRTRFSFEEVETEILKSIKQEKVIVLYSGVAAGRYLDNSAIKSYPIPIGETENFSEFVLANSEAKVFHFEHEVVRPEIIFPSHERRRNIYQIGVQHSVILHSSPYRTSRGSLDPLSLFGTLPSSKVSII